MDKQADVRKPGLPLLDGGELTDQTLRLWRFRQAHPDIEIILRGPWQAVITEADGERTIVRWDLCDLLEKLDTLVAANLPETGR